MRSFWPKGLISVAILGIAILALQHFHVFKGKGGDKKQSPAGMNEAGDKAVAPVRLASGNAMVVVPGGTFTMGSAKGEKDEAPHRVRVSSFYMDQYAVTQEEFEKLMGGNPSRWPDPKAPVDQVRWKVAAEYCNVRSGVDGLKPAYDMATWACDFAADGYRLPTEAEWEYACRAGAKTEYFFGDSPAEMTRYAWCKENGPRRPQAVGMKEPNPLGLYDMYGNVWQWCNDFYDEDYYAKSPAQDPRGPATGEMRVIRGGCWNSAAANCRSACRNSENPSYTDAGPGPDVQGFTGFRCVRRMLPGTR
jgi:formylglycine-generating enzyme required for sulfatase activity